MEAVQGVTYGAEAWFRGFLFAKVGNITAHLGEDRAKPSGMGRMAEAPVKGWTARGTWEVNFNLGVAA